LFFSISLLLILLLYYYTIIIYYYYYLISKQKNLIYYIQYLCQCLSMYTFYIYISIPMSIYVSLLFPLICALLLSYMSLTRPI
jgi:hypothetical protein